jgi:CHAD domain-containing protein
MKRKALSAMMSKHLHNIKKHSDRLPGSFDPDNIHDLRVEYKKTRAFTRLLQLERSAGDGEMPHKLKALYQCCGKVRDLQLFLKELQTRDLGAVFPESVSRWQQHLFASKEKAVQAIEAIHFNKIVNDLTRELPNHLQDNRVTKFMQQKVAAIHIILIAADEETDLHAIRKQLKDLIYVRRMYESDWEIPFPANPWKSEKELNDLASILGDFNDRCLTVSLLQAGYTDACNAPEKDSLLELYRKEFQEKETIKAQLLQQVRELGD